MNEQQRAELERIRDVLYPATRLEDYDEEIIGRVLKDINALLAQDAPPKQDVPETNFGNMAEPKIGCVNHDCDKCKAVQEPVAKKTSIGLVTANGWDSLPVGALLYTAPQPVPVKTYHDGKPWPVAPKPWVGLTDEEIEAIPLRQPNGFAGFARAVEAKLKEKNT